MFLFLYTLESDHDLIENITFILLLYTIVLTEDIS
jgi:hypothetical protein